MSLARPSRFVLFTAALILSLAVTSSCSTREMADVADLSKNTFSLKTQHHLFIGSPQRRISGRFDWFVQNIAFFSSGSLHAFVPVTRFALAFVALVGLSTCEPSQWTIFPDVALPW